MRPLVGLQPFFLLLGMKPIALHMLDKCSGVDLRQPPFSVSLFQFYFEAEWPWSWQSSCLNLLSSGHYRRNKLQLCASIPGSIDFFLKSHYLYLLHYICWVHKAAAAPGYVICLYFVDFLRQLHENLPQVHFNLLRLKIRYFTSSIGSDVYFDYIVGFFGLT